MKIGVPKEIKTHEHRVGLVPYSVKTLVDHGHSVIIESNAGLGIGISNEQYVKAGADILNDSQEIFASANMIIKVKEPQPEECRKLKPEQILFTFLHLAADKQQTELLLNSGAVAIAYETVTAKDGQLPLLAPMSEIAGRISVQIGAHYLEKSAGGKGILLSGVPGIASAKVVVLGGGVVGTNAIQIAIGMGASVTVLDKSLDKLRVLDNRFGCKIQTEFALEDIINKYVTNADLVIGAVLVPGGSAPKVVKKQVVESMTPGSVIVDVAIDQGGCIETSSPTDFKQPIYEKFGVIHQCVTNLPGSVPRTSTFALNNATLPFILELADKGYAQACLENVYLLNGLNICKGKLTNKAVAKAVNRTYINPIDILDI